MYHTLLAPYWSFLRFLLLGGIATLVNLLARFFLNKFVVFEFAIVISYFIGMIIAFVLFRYFAFPENGKKRSKTEEAVKFTVVNLWGMLQTLIVSVVLVEHVLPFLNIALYQKEIAHLSALSLLTFTSYIGHKKFTFK